MMFGAAAAIAMLSYGAAALADQADDLIARHLAARGGAEQLAAVKGLTMTGKMRPPGFDSDVTYAETITRPENVRMAFNASQGPRLVPGTYQVRITSNGQVYTQPLVVGPDRRATYTVADRQAQFAAAEKVSDIFGRMTDLMAQINAVRIGAEQRAEKLPEHDKLRERLEALSAKADVLRKEIVATKEGGAITGEERLREWTDQLYGAINSYDGRPSDYQMQRIGVLDGLLGGIHGRFTTLETGDVASVNTALTARKLDPIVVPKGPSSVAMSGGGGDLGALAGWRFTLRPTASAVAATEEAERD